MKLRPVATVTGMTEGNLNAQQQLQYQIQNAAEIPFSKHSQSLPKIYNHETSIRSILNHRTKDKQHSDTTQFKNKLTQPVKHLHGNKQESQLALIEP